jgi:hypothetical protein
MQRSIALSLVSATALLTVAAAPTAGAATVSTRVEQFHPSGTTVVAPTVVAGPGERNDITITLEPEGDFAAGSFVVRDAGGAPLTTAGDGCAVQADASVRCPLLPGGRAGDVRVLSGDGDDAVTGTGWTTFIIDGGPGADRLAIGGDRAHGILRGGDGDDVLAGGAGDDVLDGGPGADRMSGGDGRDEVSYEDRTAPVSAAIGTAGNGEIGEGDVIAADIEDLTGGHGDDRLTGDDRDNRLDGGNGADVLDGAGGNDRLRAGAAYDLASSADVSVFTDDRLLGGPGDDQLQLAGAGMAFGGPGVDTLQTQAGGLLAGGAGRDQYDIVLQQRARALVEAADDGRDGDIIRCTATPAHVVVGPSDVSLGCDPVVHRSGSKPGALIALPVQQGLAHGPDVTWLLAGCADDAARGCLVRATVLDERGHAVGHGRRRVSRGRVAAIEVRFTKAYVKRLVAEQVIPATYRASMRDARHAVRSDTVALCLHTAADPYKACD